MEEVKAPSIAAIATKYGLIQGVLAFLLFLARTYGGVSTVSANTTQTWLVSIVGAAILIVLMVLAHREIKRAHKGMMTYPQGLGSGTLLATIGAIVSSILTFIYVKFVNTGYFTTVMHAQQAALQQRGITGAQAQQAMAITGMFMTPVGLLITSVIGGLIIGFVIALIVSIFTQKADPRAVI